MLFCFSDGGIMAWQFLANLGRAQARCERKLKTLVVVGENDAPWSRLPAVAPGALAGLKLFVAQGTADSGFCDACTTAIGAGGYFRCADCYNLNLCPACHRDGPGRGKLPKLHPSSTHTLAHRFVQYKLGEGNDPAVYERAARELGIEVCGPVRFDGGHKTPDAGHKLYDWINAFHAGGLLA